MRILITGSTGFIGSYVTARLAHAGHDVIATGRHPAKLPALAELPNTRLERLDLSDSSTWPGLLSGCEALVHIALSWGDDGPAMLKADTAASVGLFEAARQSGVRRILYTSSTAANGEMTALNSENQINRPTDFYGATKAATEMYARAFAAVYPLNVHVIRPGYIFGEQIIPGSHSQADTRFRTICRSIKRGEPVKLIRHDGTQFLHAADLAAVYEALLSHPAKFSLHYALANRWCSWVEIAELAMDLSGTSVPIELEDRGYSEFPYRFDVTALQRDFGFSFDNTARLREHLHWELNRV